MAEQDLKCPNCGANATNHQNCEYCGSLLVRFVEKGIDLSKTTYMSDAEVFPGLEQELRNNLSLQRQHPNCIVETEICPRGEGTILMYADNRLNVSHEPSLFTHIEFVGNNKEDIMEDNSFKIFNSLDCFPLFNFEDDELYDSLTKKYDTLLYRYTLNYGQDVTGAARLISELLQKVYGVPLSRGLDLSTYVDEKNSGNIAPTDDEDDGEWPWWYYVVAGLILLAISKLFF